jgi:hypothetical protein
VLGVFAEFEANLRKERQLEASVIGATRAECSYSALSAAERDRADVAFFSGERFSPHHRGVAGSDATRQSCRDGSLPFRRWNQSPIALLFL